MTNRKAKATLFGASIFAAFTIWAVHYQQQQERAVRDEIQSSPIDLLINYHERLCIEVYYWMMSDGARK